MTFSEFKESILFKVLIAIIIVWATFMIVFGFTDLEISKTFVNRDLAWAKFGQDYGEPPGHVLWACCLVVLLGILIGGNDISKQKKISYVLVVLFTIAFIVGVFIQEDDLIIYGSFLAVGITVFTIVTKNKDWNNYKTFAFVVLLLAAINPLIIVQVIKTFAGRVRFRDLTPPNYPEYTPWFIFSGITGNESFPSGHTAMGWMFLPLLILVRDREWKDPVKILTWIGVLGWGIFVGLSRLFIGAHYASDVLFSTGIAAVTTIILYWKFYRS